MKKTVTNLEDPAVKKNKNKAGLQSEDRRLVSNFGGGGGGGGERGGDLRCPLYWSMSMCDVEDSVCTRAS